MRTFNSIPNKIVSQEELEKRLSQWSVLSKTIVFTNGCFDILHAGHIQSLTQAANEGDFLIVGLNSDASVNQLKGENRPVNNEQARAQVLASLSMVDVVVIFNEDTPLELIKKIMPDVLVKGGDYKLEEIVGSKEVIANGGRVVINPILQGYSTTSVINKFSN